MPVEALLALSNYADDLSQTSFHALICAARLYIVLLIQYVSYWQLDALEYIHSKEYTHADLKAANILLGHNNNDEVRIGTNLQSFIRTCFIFPVA